MFTLPKQLSKAQKSKIAPHLEEYADDTIPHSDPRWEKLNNIANLLEQIRTFDGRWMWNSVDESVATMRAEIKELKTLIDTF